MTTTATSWQAQATNPQRSRLGRLSSAWSFGRPSPSSQPRARAQTLTSSYVPESGSLIRERSSGIIAPRKADKGKGREIVHNNMTVNDADGASWDSLMDDAQMSDPFRNSRASWRGGPPFVPAREDASPQSQNPSGSTSGHGHGHADSYSGHPYGIAGAYTANVDAYASDDRGWPRSRYSPSPTTLPGAAAAAAPVTKASEAQSFVSAQPRQHPFASTVSVPGQIARDRGDQRVKQQQFQTTSGKQIAISFPSPDLNGVGIGESPVPAHRGPDAARRGHQHVRSHEADHGFKLFPHSHSQKQQQQQQSQSHQPQVHLSSNIPRGSFSSFWTFGHGSHGKGPAASTGRLSGDSSSQSQSRPSTSAAAQYGSPSVLPPTLPQTSSISVRPRANTTMEMLSPAHASSELLSPISNTTSSRQRSGHSSSKNNVVAPADPYERLRREVVHDDEMYPIEAEDAEVSSYPSHPYATALPNKGHREYSTLLPADKARQRGKSKERRIPLLNFTIPSKASMNNLRSAASRGFLKASASTPNLRGANQGGANFEKQSDSSTSPGFGSKWLSAETWCDALIFPRPRFRVRAAHHISPPESPVLGLNEKEAQSRTLRRLNGGPEYGAPPFSAPVTTITRSDDLYDNHIDRRGDGGLIVTPSSAPPLSGFATENGEEVKKEGGENSTRDVSGTKTNPSRPPRPKSFALDDLALPSPVPSLFRVLKDREEFNKERDGWKQKASKSFQNKRSRSLSRSRAKAMEKRIRKISESDDELKTSFAFIAASAFLGSQTIRPSISEPPQSSAVSKATNSVGVNTFSTHSRKSSGTSQGQLNGGYSSTRGHGRKESWGKTALKATAGLCAFGATDVSPVEEKLPNFAGQARDRLNYAALQDGQDTSVAARSNGVLLIAPYPKPPPEYAPQNRLNAQLAPSPVPSSAESTSRSGVGIAVSTPSALLPVGQEDMFQFASHPFASSYKDELPHPSDYAGPHPSSAKAQNFNVDDMKDINVRHRRQPSAGTAYAVSAPMSHPYAAAVDTRARPAPFLRIPTTAGGLMVPPTTMFAQVGNGDIREILPDEFQYSPYSQNTSSKSSVRNSDALGVAEALSMAFSRAGMTEQERSPAVDDKGAFAVVEYNDDEDGDGDDENSDFQRDENDTGISVAAAQIVTAMSAIKSPAELRHAIMPRVDESSVFTGPVEDSNENSWRAGTNEGISRQESFGSQRGPFYAPIFKQESSLDSSPMASPRQISSMEEEDYQDLFYRPGVHSAGNSIRRTPSSELVRNLGSRTPSGSEPGRVFSRPSVAKTASTGSALTNLSRQLSEEYGSHLDEERQTFGAIQDSPRSHQFIDVEEREDEVLPLEDSDGLVFGMERNASVPLKVSDARHASADPSMNVPEDIESEAALSMEGQDEAVDETEVVYRLGEVSTLATPNPTTHDGVEHRFSTHGSYFEHEERHIDEDGEQEALAFESQPQSAHHSLRPPLSAATTDATRSSYLTSGSSTSRISQLSEFPVPPTNDAREVVISPGQILQSYFLSTPTPTRQRGDPLDADFDGAGAGDGGLSDHEDSEQTVMEHGETEVVRPPLPRTRNRSATFGVDEVPDL